MDYKNFHKEVISMQHRMRDYLDSPQHTDARELEKRFQRLEDNVQVNKNVHTIRDDLKQINSICESMDDEVMSHNHVDFLQDWVRDCLQKIR